MNRHLLILCLVFSAFNAAAQKDSVYYFNKYNIRIGTKDSADFYRIIDSVDRNRLRFTEYRKDGSWVKASAKGSIENPGYDGYVNLYYKNGKLNEMHDYTDGHATKTLRYHINGTLLQTIIYDTKSGAFNQARLVYEADSAGNVNMINGNGTRKESGVYNPTLGVEEKYTMEGPYVNSVKDGVWKGVNDRGFKFEEYFENGKSTGGNTITADGKKHHFDIPRFTLPQFKHDRDHLEDFIKSHLKNPADTLLLDRWPKRLLLTYTITENGEVTDIAGTKNTDHSKFALELTKECPKVKPATLRGMPVSMFVHYNNMFGYKTGLQIQPFNTDIYIKGQYTLPTR